MNVLFSRKTATYSSAVSVQTSNTEWHRSSIKDASSAQARVNPPSETDSDIAAYRSLAKAAQVVEIGMAEVVSRSPTLMPFLGGKAFGGPRLG